MIIDKKSPKFADIPDSLDGEVLLERVRDGDGNLLGLLTAPVSMVAAMKTKTDAELAATGWLKYKNIILSV